MSVAMSQAEREAFLARPHVAVLAVAQPSGPPLLAPVWYAYEPGGLLSISMEASSRKAGLLRAAGRLSLCAQDDTRPYKYVAIEGVVVGVERALLGERQALALRYLGPEQGAAFAAELEDSENEIMVRVQPVKWRTVDYAKAEE